AKDRRVDGRQHRDPIADLNVAADADLLARWDGHRHPALRYRKVGGVAAAEEVTGRGDEVGGHGITGRDVYPGALARHLPDGCAGPRGGSGWCWQGFVRTPG